MFDYLLALLLLSLAVLGIIVRKTVFAVPVNEQKRRAIHGSNQVKALYRIAAYDGSARVLFWTWISVTFAAGIVVLAIHVPAWITFVVTVLLLWFGFSWLPARKESSLGLRITLAVAPSISWLLNLLYKPLHASSRVVAHRYMVSRHTGMFEREDIIDLLERQQKQDDNRMSSEDINIALQALRFDDYTASDVMTPISSVMSVKSDAQIGPVLIDEIHKSGMSHVLVRDSSKAPVQGTLAFARLTLQTTGTVGSLMDDTVYYVHEKDVLSQVLKTFYQTNHPVLLVVDNSGELVGVISMQNIIEKLVGHMPGEDFDQYSDPQVVVARYHVKKSKPTDIEYEEVIE